MYAGERSDEALDFTLYHAQCAVIGNGAAGLSAVNRLTQAGVDTILVTEAMNAGTSRNAGSDKQTYYKLALGGDAADSVRKMAADLYACGKTDGDTALSEAALSAKCFLYLSELGVAFPKNRYGEYIGYKTDHDPYARASSAGPLTSKDMTEALEKKVLSSDVRILSGRTAVKILMDGGRTRGVLLWNLKDERFEAVLAPCVVLATGGPAGIYEDVVYPESQHGSTGLAIEAGAVLQNLAIWQYGLASVAPRWNVSGTYMQVLPRFLSVDGDGTEREFLLDYYHDPYEALSQVFLKGYQWPFDERKAENGSSRIDLLVYEERVVKGRLIFLDYTENPFGLKEIDFGRLSPEAGNYLRQAGADFGTPIERLLKMNLPAVELYRGKGVDLEKERLEIALCAQHHNGGVAVNAWWETSVPGLYAIGECAGTHGLTRPGGSALNAGQVGAYRAAEHIAAFTERARGKEADNDIPAFVTEAVRAEREFIDRLRVRPDNCAELISMFRHEMTVCAAAVKDSAAIERLEEKAKKLVRSFTETAGIGGNGPVSEAYRLKDILCTQWAVLESMQSDDKDPSRILEVRLADGELRAEMRPVRPIPEENASFETVWASYRENGNVY